MAEHGHSEACCTVPAAVSKNYSEKGKYLDANGTKVYHTGDSSASSAIFIIYDIFGLSSQAKQGADILAYANSDRQIQVFMPDLFNGNPAPLDLLPANTPEKKKQFDAFFSGPANISDTKEKIPKILESLNAEVPGIKKWGVIGACWGGKLVSLLSTSGTPFSVAAEVHPAMLDPADATEITIPVCILPSKGEDVDDVKEFQKNLTVENHVETFADQVHGWMFARADLENDRVRAEYERGYKTVLEFFVKYL